MNETSCPISTPRDSLLPVLSRAMLLAGVTLVVWHGALDGAFVFDDDSNIVDNPRIQSLWPLDPFLASNRPLGLYSFALNYALHGLNRFGFHAVNLGIHLAAGLLLFGLVRRTLLLPRCGGRFTTAEAMNLAAASAAIWLVHPLTTQAVTYVVQRYESAAGMFYVGLLYCVCRSLSSTRPALWMGAAILVSWCGFLSKETAATAPLAATLYDRVFVAGSWRGALKRWPFYLALLSPLAWFVPRTTGFHLGQSSSMGFAMKSITPWQYAATQPEILLHYVRLAFWPTPLCFDYLWPVQTNPYRIAGASVVIAGLAILSLCGLLRGKPWGFVAFLFFLVLAPTSSFMPIADLAVEHRMYLPLMAVVVLTVVGGWSLLAARRPLSDDATPKSSILEAGLVLGFAGIVLLLGWRTVLRNRDYRDPVYLWSSAVKIRPNSPRAWYGLGLGWHARNDFQKALDCFENGLQQNVPMVQLHLGAGDCLQKFGRFDEAEAHYRKAFEFKSHQEKAHHNFGVLLYSRGRRDEALQHFAQAAAKGLADARYNHGSLSIELGREREGLSELEELLRERPGHSPSASRIAWVLSTSEDSAVRDGARALSLLTEVCKADRSESYWMMDTLAAAYAENGGFDKAAALAAEAVSRARAAGKESLADAFDVRRRRYASKQPWRGSAKLETPIEAELSSPGAER